MHIDSCQQTFTRVKRFWHLKSNSVACLCFNAACFLQERERRSPALNLHMTAFPENSSSALQIYCHQEGVKVNTYLVTSQYLFFTYICIILCYIIYLRSSFCHQWRLILTGCNYSWADEETGHPRGQRGKVKQISVNPCFFSNYFNSMIFCSIFVCRISEMRSRSPWFRRGQSSRFVRR